MDKEQALTEVIEWAKAVAEKGEAIASREVPLLVQEAISWYFWCSIITILANAVVITALTAVATWVYTALIRPLPAGADRDGCTLLVLVLWVAAAGGSFAWLLFGGVVPAVKACVAPRLVVVEEIGKYLK